MAFSDIFGFVISHVGRLRSFFQNQNCLEKSIYEDTKEAFSDIFGFVISHVGRLRSFFFIIFAL